MSAELLFAAIIIGLGVLFVALLPLVTRAVTSEPEKPGNAPKEPQKSWFTECYEPCMEDPDQSSDSCVMRCNLGFM
jgi:hypothetical protein